MLINREHSRLSSQVKTLERVLHAPFSDKEHQRLVQLAANWRSLLAFDDGAPKLAGALAKAAAGAIEQLAVVRVVNLSRALETLAELGWRATRTVDDICADSWRWQSRNPDGYR